MGNRLIVKELKAKLYELTKVHLQRKYGQDAITYEILQKMMQEKVLERAKESVLENDRSIKLRVHKLTNFCHLKQIKHGLLTIVYLPFYL